MPLPYWPLTFQLHRRLLRVVSLIGAQFAEVFVQRAFLLLRGLQKGDRQAFVSVATLDVAGRWLVGQGVYLAQGFVVFQPGHVHDRHFSLV